MMAWLQCPNCGTQYIDDPRQLIIWDSLDNEHPLCECSCPGCSYKAEDIITKDSALFLIRSGVNFKSLNEKHLVLSNQEIDSWNIDEELIQIGLR